MSDEAKQRVLAVWPDAWEGLSGIWRSRDLEPTDIHGFLGKSWKDAEAQLIDLPEEGPIPRLPRKEDYFPLLMRKSDIVGGKQ